MSQLNLKHSKNHPDTNPHLICIHSDSAVVVSGQHCTFAVDHVKMLLIGWRWTGIVR